MADRVVATWNVNSIRSRLQHVLDWLRDARPDVLCLQETKTPDDLFPFDALRQAGYHAATAGQKGYNGVAVLSRDPLGDPRAGFPGDPDPSQARVLSGLWDGIRLVNVYVPNGATVGSEKFAYKLAWLEAFAAWLAASQDPAQPLLLAGDFNIAPEDRDVHDPAAWSGKLLCSEPERRALRRLLEWGLADLLRLHHAEGGHYSWWDYRAGRFRRNQGLRIDLVLGTRPVAARTVAVEIDRRPRGWPTPSDHAPVVARLAAVEYA